MASGPMSASSDDDFDRRSERFDGYGLNADVSESESSSSTATSAFSCDRRQAASSTSTLDFDSNSEFSPLVVLPPVVAGIHVTIPTVKPEKCKSELPEAELMKERFAKLLLGEDMSGGRKGVCTALAISNAITNLAATVFGDLWKLEPLAPQRKSMWCKEMKWLLSVSDSIVELVPSRKEFPGVGTFEVMVPQPRPDLYVNLPALKKLDAMLISILDGFRDSEFCYVDRGVVVADGEHIEAASPRSPSSHQSSIRLEEKWWLPFPKIPPNGLPEETRKLLRQCRDRSNQIFKAALSINKSVLSEMVVPEVYLDSLPKSGKESLGEILYRYITADQLSPECLDYLDLSSEYAALEIANRIEAAMHIWRQKYQKKKLNRGKKSKSSWGGAVKGLVAYTERDRLLSQRAETLLSWLELNFPGLPQTTLDMNKIHYNRDVGQAIIESYSRVLESLAFNLMARIEDLLYVDDDARRQRSAGDSPVLNQNKNIGSHSLQKWAFF